MTNAPPFLRFPSGGVLWENLFIGGVYLTTQVQEYAVFVYNLRARVWSKLNYHDAELNSRNTSWNFSFFNAEHAKYVLLGSSSSSTSLLSDYNDRIINFTSLLEMDIAGYGIVPHTTYSGLSQNLGISMLQDGLADIEIACFDRRRQDDFESDASDASSVAEDSASFTTRTRRIGVLSKVLEKRWGDYFVALTAAASTAARRHSSHASADSGGDAPADGNNSRSRVLFIPERYEIVAALVQWFYTDVLDPSWDVEVLSGLLGLARTYKIPALQREVVLRMHEFLDKDRGAQSDRIPAPPDAAVSLRDSIFYAAAAVGETGLLKHGQG
ncbi:uncharacterized protein V1518DRAFT_436611 [Limtongia smithiae]|uniref:uncharacterized protein n=1 Tax=Limtongia smithiae TaxID=1125753 RepID=UPI0034CD0216